MRVGIVFVAIALAALVGGCGGGEKKKEKPAVTAQTPTNNPPVKPQKSGAPQKLLGQYEVKIPLSDLPQDAPVAASATTDTWTVSLAETGGPGDGPAFSIANGQAEPIETSTFQVKGDKILLRDQTCTSGKPVDSEFTYELKGDELHLEDAKNACSDGFAELILTTLPLKKKE